MENNVSKQNHDRELILAASEKLFANNSFENTSLFMISQEAGVSMLEIAGFFNSKKELLTEIFLVRLGHLKKMLAHIPELKVSIDDRFLIFVNVYTMTSKNEAFLCLLQREITFWSSSPVRDLIEYFIKNTLEILSKIVENAVAVQYINHADKQFVYLSLFSVMPVMSMGRPVTDIVNDTLDPGGFSFSNQRIKLYLINLLKKNQPEYIFRA